MRHAYGRSKLSDEIRNQNKGGSVEDKDEDKDEGKDEDEDEDENEDEIEDEDEDEDARERRKVKLLQQRLLKSASELSLSSMAPNSDPRDGPGGTFTDHDQITRQQMLTQQHVCGYRNTAHAGCGGDTSG